MSSEHHGSPAVPVPFRAGPFRRALLAWWSAHARRFPWRETRDPFAIFVAEVLLHRTRATQVIPLYRALLERAPSARELGAMPPDELASLLRPAGLLWRVRLLHNTAAALVERFNGAVPSGRDELESLPGVGHYIATAVRTFAFGQADVVQDTNTVRIAGRVFGVQVTDASRRSPRMRALLERIRDPRRPRDLQLALLDLGALVCQAGRPRCEECPVRRWCVLGARGSTMDQRVARQPDDCRHAGGEARRAAAAAERITESARGAKTGAAISRPSVTTDQATRSAPRRQPREDHL